MPTELTRFIAPDLRPPIGAYVHAVVHGGLVYCSGQVGVEPSSGAVPEGVAAQTRQALSNLAAALAAAGSGADRVVKVTVYLRDNAMFGAMDTAFARFFGESRPARTTIPGIAFRPGVDVEIDLIAAAG